jgi:hypothetical protein
MAASLAFANYWMSTDRFAFAVDYLTASFNAQSPPKSRAASNARGESRMSP